MKLSLSRPGRVARIAAGALLGAAALVVLFPDPARAAAVTIERTSDWGAGHVARVTVSNDTTTDLTQWRVEFDLPAGTSVTSYWSSRLNRSGDHYVFTNESWNGTVPPGGETRFGFVAAGSGAPLNCTVNGAPCAGGPATLDAEPPSTPTNLRWTAGSINALWWDAATDNRGVVAYEVYHRGFHVGTITGTRWDLPGIPPPMPTVYGVSAVDAAGNKSPLATAYLSGRPTDQANPTAPTGLALSLPTRGYLAVRWTAATDDLIVVGYEVEVNGVLTRTVGGTTAYVPAGSHGVFYVAVRAVDSAGKYSPYARQYLIIEPPVTRTS